MTSIRTETAADVTPRRGLPSGRLFALGGLLFVALELACIAIQGGEAPSRHSSPAKIGAYFRDHAGAIKASEVLAALGVAALLWWSGGLWELLRADDRDAAGPGAGAHTAFATGMALALVDISAFGTAAFGARTLGDESLVLLYDLSTAAILLSGAGLAVFLAVVCMRNAVARVLPTWTIYVGAITALGLVVAIFGIGADADALVSAAYLAFLGWCVWIAGVSVAMWRHSAQRPPLAGSDRA